MSKYHRKIEHNRCFKLKSICSLIYSITSHFGINMALLRRIKTQSLAKTIALEKNMFNLGHLFSTKYNVNSTTSVITSSKHDVVMYICPCGDPP